MVPLIEALRDGDVAAGAAWALGRIGDPAAAAPLVALLERSELQLRAAAARALGAVGDRGAVLALEALVNDPATDPGLRNAGLDSLVALGYAPEGMRPTSLVMWASGLALVAGGVAAAAAWGALAIVPFAAGLGLLFLYYVREVRRARKGGWYAPSDDGEAIWVPAGLGGAIGDVGDGGGNGGGGG